MYENIEIETKIVKQKSTINKVLDGSLKFLIVGDNVHQKEGKAALYDEEDRLVCGIEYKFKMFKGATQIIEVLRTFPLETNAMAIPSEEVIQEFKKEDLSVNENSVTIAEVAKEITGSQPTVKKASKPRKKNAPKASN